MAFINITTSITRNRKFKRFKRYLGKDDAEALGHLASLWSNVLELAEDGDITKWTQEDTAEYANYHEDPQRLWEALTLEDAPFIDIGENRILIHKWWDYAGRYLTAKYRTNNSELLSYIKNLYKKTDHSQTAVGNNTTKIDNIDKIDNIPNSNLVGLLNHFKNLKGYSTLTNYGRHMKRAKDLLKIAGDLQTAKSVLSWLAETMDKKGLSWKFETAIDWYPEWEKQQKINKVQEKRGQEAQEKIEKMKKEHEADPIDPKDLKELTKDIG